MDTLVLALIVGLIIVVVVGLVVWRRGRDVPPEIVRDSARSTTKLEPPPAAPPPLRTRLGKTRSAIAGKLGGLLRSEELDAEFWTDLEDTLVSADLGVATAEQLVQEIRATNPANGEDARIALEEHLVAVLEGQDRTLIRTTEPSVILVVGVNGTGKTTSIAKLAAQLVSEGEQVLLGAADTFRAAAGDQLKAWGERIGVRVVGGQAGADPASVAFDAFKAGTSDGVDRVIVDTAGRLHSKANLMDELSKVARVLRREAGEIDEILLVIDGTTGQNVVDQARTFTEVVGVTGVVITKLDGTPRGGMAIAVERELGVPIKFIGVGEGVEDLIAFEPEAFVDALLGA